MARLHTSRREGSRRAGLPRVYDPAAHEYRVRYAISTILRGRIVNGSTFTNCFEMGDGDRVVLTILRRGLKNPKLRAALLRSHIINLNNWLVLHPGFSERYLAAGEE